MKIKQIIISALLGFGLTASPFLAIAADKKDMDAIINKTLSQDIPAVQTQLGFGKHLEHKEQISEDTERRTYFTVYYMPNEGKNDIRQAKLIIEDWKKVEGQEMPPDKTGCYGHGKFYDGYVITRKVINDTRTSSDPPDGLIDEAVQAQIIVTEEGNGISYDFNNISLLDGKVKEELQKLYDENIEAFLNNPTTRIRI